MFSEGFTAGAYLIAAILFIRGLKKLQSPVTARRGNRLAAIGMLLAIVATLFSQQILTPAEMIGGLAVGGFLGAVMAKRVKMTGMPELVAAFNGFGGLASALVAGAEIARIVEQGEGFGDSRDHTGAYLSILVGMVTFSGSFIAFLKRKMTGNPIQFTGRYLVLATCAAAAVGSIVWIFVGGDMVSLIMILAGLSLILGILLVLPIGGADMPVIVAFLNALSGLAAAATGFVLSNTVLIISGALVGASGIMLTRVMCVAMNRRLWHVLVGGFGGDSDDSSDGAKQLEDGRTITSTTPDDTAILLSYARKVIIVPGYGLAVAQAQHQVRELADVLQEHGVEVKYAIHPVAGRMPGHMNVLLAEANVPYDSSV